MTDSGRAEITALVFAYAELLDAGDLDGVAALFAAAVWRSPDGRIRHGQDEIRRMYDPIVLYADGTPRSKHVVTNVVIEIDEPELSARARSSFAVLQSVEGSPLRTVLAGRYHDRFERIDGTWAYRERAVHPDLVGDLRRHMAPPSPTQRG